MRTVETLPDNAVSAGLRTGHGFTAIEVLIAIGLMAATAGITVPMYRQYQAYADLDTAAEHLVQAIRAAQTLSQTGKFDSAWGVFFPDGTLYAGKDYAVRNDEKDVSFPLPGSVETDGLTEVSFTRVDGLPTSVGVVCIFSYATDGYRTLTIDANGLVTVSGILQGSCDTEGSSSSGNTSSSGGSEGTGSSSSVNSSSGGSEGTGSSSSVNSSSGGSEGTGSSSSVNSSSGGSEGTGSSSSVNSSSGGSEGTGSSSSVNSSSGGSEGTGSSSSTSSIGSSESGGGEDDGESDETSNDGEPPCDVRFTLDRAGNLKSAGTNDVRLKVLGSAITYGAGGPKVAVRISASTDGGTKWSDLFGGKAVDGNEQEILSNLAGDTPIIIRINGRYSWLFNKTYRTDANDGHVYALRNGDSVPDFTVFDNQPSLQSFLKKVINANGKVSIGPKDVLFIVELGTLNTRSSDFQDAVILATFTEKPGTCTDKTKSKVKIHFDRLENMGSGNAQNKVYVGPNALAFSADQWIPLQDTSGNTIVDGGLVEDVKGIALERGNGWIRVVQHGSHASGKEIVDAKVLFNKAFITSTVNEVDTKASENPTDGIVNDTASGDEFVPGPNAKSMTFQTRVTTADDGVILYWSGGEPSDAGTQSSGSSSSSSSSVATEIPDPCAVPFSVDASGMVRLEDDADVTVRIAGSQATYGNRGPRVNVRTRISFDGGRTWEQLYNYRSLRGNEFAVFPNAASGSQIMLSFHGRYSWVFNRTVESGRDSARVKVLRKGESFSGLPSILSRGQLQKYLRNIVDNNGKMNIGNRDLAFLVELGDIANGNYHDAVALLSIDKPARRGACGSTPGSTSSLRSTSSSSSTGSASSASSSSSSLAADGDTDEDGIKNADDLCPFDTVIPESVPTEYMSFDRFALTAAKSKKKSDIAVFREGPRRRVSKFSLADTQGCSCEQILDAIEGNGYHRFQEHPALYRHMKNLFAFYIRTSRKFGCGSALLKMVSDSR